MYRMKCLRAPCVRISARLLVAAILLVNGVHAQDNLRLGTPSADLPIIDREGYALAYSEAHEQPAWVAYHLTDREVTAAHVDRTDDFRTDPAVASGTATLADYVGSGYDRGHLAPAADMAWDATVMSESFYFSNISPQEPGFNRGVWRKLEECVRDWAVAFGDVWVVAGPVLGPRTAFIGPSEVTVPRQFFKAVLCDRCDPPMAIGFVVSNYRTSARIEDLAVTVDAAEFITGLDFFAALPDSVERAVEADMDWMPWAAGLGARIAAALPEAADRESRRLGAGR